MSTRQTKQIPKPVYAAAGAGDLVYQKLCALPEKVGELRERAVELRPVVVEKVRSTDLGRLRDAARRNASQLAHNAQAAQQRASVLYTDLVARGERVVHAKDHDDQPEARPEDVAFEAEVEAEAEVTEVDLAEVEVTEVDVAEAEAESVEPAAAQAPEVPVESETPKPRARKRAAPRKPSAE
jgi:heparin binding hemagglutinin HbhA